MTTDHPAVDREAITAEMLELMRSGMPDAVIEGFMRAKVRDLANRYSADQWSQIRKICDEVGQQVHQGDPVKKARVEEFNDMFIAALKRKQDR